MKKILFLAHPYMLILLLANYTLSAQTSDKEYAAYYNLCNEALVFKVNKEYEKAVIKYEQAFEGIFPFLDDLKELKTCYKQLGDTAMVKDVWKRMVLTGFTTSGKSYLITPNQLKSEWTMPVPNDEQVIFDKINYDSLHRVFLTQVNIEKHNYLQAIVTGECFVGAMRAYYSNDDTLYYIVEDAGFMTNGRLFLNLLKSNYMPSRKETNLWNDENGFIVALVHIAATLKGEELEDFFSRLKHHMWKGDLYPAQYAAIYDHAYDGAYYGMSRQFNEDTGEIETIPPKDIKNVDARRAEIFLPPLWVWAKKTDTSLPKNYIHGIN
jgi:hypothetical protein